jgi:hypothetical protein
MSANDQERPSQAALEADISIHIFSVSAAMVGVCLTVIGLFRVIAGSAKIDTLGDDLLALDAFLFLGSCILSYWALRTRSTKRMHRVEQVADVIFLVALSLMVAVCALITYAVV